jgi:hypothetical protein
MSETQRFLRCPYCNHASEAMPPDSMRSAYSFEIPVTSGLHGQVKKEETECKNPKCRKLITIYWYASMEYLETL